MNLQQLRELLLGGYEIGTWFYIPAAHTSFAPAKGLPRPFVLVRPWQSNHPIAHCRPRSASGPSGIPHNAHTPGHYATCRVNKPGFIVHVFVSIQAARITSHTFSCVEPDESIVAKITPKDLR